MTAKRHHYVPRFLVARFANPAGPRGTLVQLDRGTGRALRTSPTNAAVIGHYYDFTTGGDDFPVDGVEDVLGIVEGATAPLIAGLATPNAVLGDEDRLTLALFVAFLFLRVPSQRAWLRLIDERAGKKMVRDMAEQPEIFQIAMKEIGEPADEEDRRRLIESLDRGGIEFKAPPERQLTMMMGLAIDLAWEIAAMSWSILRTPKTGRFVLGDSPVTMFDPTLKPPRGNALRSSEKAETVVPLDPNFALAIRPVGDEFDEQILGNSELLDINLRTYAWADRWVFGFSQNDLTGLRAQAKRRPSRVAVRRPLPPAVVLDAELIDGRRSIDVVEHTR
ncbi:MAG TPA: DUF4238 domain-containing protein [Solirubrobacterales bacterium]|nr:DUF4238 domain-containing protein [Solirubrobacterales bacterium]